MERELEFLVGRAGGCKEIRPEVSQVHGQREAWSDRSTASRERGARRAHPLLGSDRAPSCRRQVPEQDREEIAPGAGFSLIRLPRPQIAGWPVRCGHHRACLQWTCTGRTDGRNCVSGVGCRIPGSLARVGKGPAVHESVAMIKSMLAGYTQHHPFRAGPYPFCQVVDHKSSR